MTKPKDDALPWHEANITPHVISGGHVNFSDPDGCDNGRFIPEDQARAGYEAAKILLDIWTFDAERLLDFMTWKQSNDIETAMKNLRKFIGTKP